MFNITFANPGFLYALLLVIPLIVWYVLRNNSLKPALRVSETFRIKKYNSGWRVGARHSVFAFRVLAITLLIVVLARPQSTNTKKNVDTEGIDIVIALDISSSMLAQDFHPDRLEAAKNVAIEFISGRPNDRIGLVVYSAESFTQCPLTTDHAVLINFFKDLKSGMLEDGTAIGSGLATSVNRLKDSDAKSKVVILLTDGVNNTGQVPPLTAAEIAKTFGIRVYTVGIGTQGTAPYPFMTPFGIQVQNIPVEIDENMLSKIATETNGRYFRATNNQKLREIYKEIDRLEKTKFQVTEYSRREEKYFWVAVIAGAFLLVEFLLRFIVFRTIP
jgi:Ca-activated chloride channel family protein